MKTNRAFFIVINLILVLLTVKFTINRFEFLNYLFSEYQDSLFRIIKILKYDLLFITIGILSVIGAVFKIKSYWFYLFSSFFLSMSISLILMLDKFELITIVIIILNVLAIFLFAFYPVYKLNTDSLIRRILILSIGVILYTVVRRWL